MEILKSESKKRAHRDAFEDGAATEKKESRVAKLPKKESPTTTATKKTSTMKESYDKYEADVVADRDSPAYVMALNYLKAYGKCSYRH